MKNINITIKIRLHDDIYRMYKELHSEDHIREIIENEINLPCHDEYSGLETWIISNHRQYME